MKTLYDVYREAADFFQQMESDFDATQDAYQYILTTMDTALASKDYTSLLSLIPYIEEDAGHLAFQYIGETHHLLRMLNIITLEKKYQKPLFCDGCDSTGELWEKYMLTLFAFRRLIFQLSEESVNEAVAYLQNHPLSHFAAYMLVQNEHLIPDQNFYETLALIYAEEWGIGDTQQFFTLINSSTCP